MAYNKYSAKEINDLNTTIVWRQAPITIKDETNSNDTKYVLHATGECDLNGRTYIALPASLNINDSDIKKKYNLM